ncbi:MAG: PqqD family protein [Clostridia bacterium]|nr:PqqD family protein [Clostridia bacterium]
MKLKEGFVLRQVAGETVVIPSGDTLDLNMMITLNDTGKLLWEALEKGAEEADLVAALLAEYEVSEETARKGVASFVAKLNENGFLA